MLSGRGCRLGGGRGGAWLMVLVGGFGEGEGGFGEGGFFALYTERTRHRMGEEGSRDLDC